MRPRNQGAMEPAALVQGLSLRHPTKDWPLFRLKEVVGLPDDRRVVAEILSPTELRECVVLEGGKVVKTLVITDEEETVRPGQMLVFKFLNQENDLCIQFDFSTLFVAPPKKEKKTVRIEAAEEAPVSLLWMVVLFCNQAIANFQCAKGLTLGRGAMGAYIPDQMAGISRKMLTVTWSKKNCVGIRIETDKFVFAVDNGGDFLCTGSTCMLRRGETLSCYAIQRDENGFPMQCLDSVPLMQFTLEAAKERDDAYDHEQLDEPEDMPELDYATDNGEDKGIVTRDAYNGLTARRMSSLNVIVRRLLGSQIRSNFREEVPEVSDDENALDLPPPEVIEKLQDACDKNKVPKACLMKIDSVLTEYAKEDRMLRLSKQKLDELEKNKTLFLEKATEVENRYKKIHGADYRFEYIIKNTNHRRGAVPLSQVTTRFVDGGATRCVQVDSDGEEQIRRRPRDDSDADDEAEETKKPKRGRRVLVDSDSDE